MSPDPSAVRLLTGIATVASAEPPSLLLTVTFGKKSPAVE